MNGPKRTVLNPKFGRPGEYPKKEQEAATISDLIDELTRIRDEVGEIPVILTCRDRYGDWESDVMLVGECLPFEIREAVDGRGPGYASAMDGWPYSGPTLEVKVDP